MPTLPRIAIIGAGPAGLTLARILQHNGMRCTIFELDHDRSVRDQGGIVGLHPQSGQLALREAGLLEDFQQHVLPAAEAMKLIKSDGRVCWDENDMKGVKSHHTRGRPEIDRSALRNILLDSIQPNSIQWNRKLVRVQPSNDSQRRYDLHFADSMEEGFDLVIGADGAWSKVRSLLTDLKPHYSGITIIELIAQDVSTHKPWLSNFVGSGSLFMFDEGRALICQRNGNDSIRVYAAVRQPESWLRECGIDWTHHSAARTTLMERYFGDCANDIRRVIASEASDGLRSWPLYMLPIDASWPSCPGVTLLGDAAHLMTPFAGVGVNVALADALDLATALMRRKDAFEAGNVQECVATAVEEYEASMFERARQNMEKSSQGLRHHFSAEGIEERVARLRGWAKMVEEERARREGAQAPEQIEDEKLKGEVPSASFT